ncbi:MAG: Mfa1 family fimbria major subunit [Rikenellaceae bacterium]
MKKITMLCAAMVAMMAYSCQEADVTGYDDKQDVDVAYLSLSVSTPTRAADSEDEDGTTDETSVGDESKIYTLALVAFDYNYDFIGSYQAYASDGKFNCEVAPDARRFFAVVNPTSAIWDAINGVSSYNQSAFSSLPAITMAAADVSTENYKTNSSETRGFTMVNAGAKNTSSILLESLVSIDTELSEDIDNPTPLTIAVDRMVAKFEFSVSTSFDSNTSTLFGETSNYAVGEVQGVALTATNKAAYLYSTILTDELAGGNVYRTDHNMTVGQGLTEAGDIREALNENFNWLTNENELTDKAFIAPNSTDGVVATTPEYVLENTVEPSYSNSNNLTQAIVKAAYNPCMTTTGEPLALGTSWFKILTSDGTGTLYLTFAEVVQLYTDKFDLFTADENAKTSMDVQLNHILGTEGRTWADGLTLAELDARPYGGYKAATVAEQSDYVIQYYQNAVSYYDIFIQHDDSQSIGHAGRWGMVRNNSYRMDISGIMHEGLPYIPDPTDPDIVDPENQDPADPEPADELNAYISVTISVNPWVLWYQETVLM